MLHTLNIDLMLFFQVNITNGHSADNIHLFLVIHPLTQ